MSGGSEVETAAKSEAVGEVAVVTEKSVVPLPQLDDESIAATEKEEQVQTDSYTEKDAEIERLKARQAELESELSQARQRVRVEYKSIKGPDTEARAWQRACDELLKREPGLLALVERLRALKDQYLSSMIEEERNA